MGRALEIKGKRIAVSDLFAEPKKGKYYLILGSQICIKVGEEPKGDIFNLLKLPEIEVPIIIE